MSHTRSNLASANEDTDRLEAIVQGGNIRPARQLVLEGLDKVEAVGVSPNN